MVELLTDFPKYVVACRIKSGVEMNEYRSVVIARAEDLAATFGSINFLLKVEADVEKNSMAPLFDLISQDLQHLLHCNRMAIVADQNWVHKLFDDLYPSISGKIRYYHLSEYEKAGKWISVPFMANKKYQPQRSATWAGIVGTSAMTAFSYALGSITKNKFGEPYLLGLFISRLGGKEEKKLRVLGWPTHYAVGICFALSYQLTTRLINKQMKARDGIPFGIVTGAMAIAFWRQLFKLHPRPPRVDQKAFYTQLFFAHLVFALATTLVLNDSSKESDNTSPV